MADTALLASRTLRLLLAVGVLGALAGTLAGDGGGAQLARVVGIAAVVGGPFVVLAVVALRERTLAWFAGATILLALAGALLAR